MILGYFTEFSEEELSFLHRLGFEGIEVRAHRGSRFMQIWEGEGREGIQELVEKYNIQITALATHSNHLSPDSKEREVFNAHLRKLLDIASQLHVRVVATFTGRIPELSIEDNISEFRKVFSPILKEAEDKGVKIALENCPMMHGHPFRGINLAFTPRAWEMIFEAVPSSHLGLEFDPSHLVWLGVDYLKAARDFQEKIFHVHAKDTEILPEVLQEVSIFGKGWWRYRLPGFGEVDWQGFLSVLKEAGYKGGVVIEHEDPVFEGERREEGVVHSYKFLSPLI